MLIKAGVDISRLKPCIRKKLDEIEAICIRYNKELVVTSTYEGNHMASSLHYANEAVDIRLPEKNVHIFLEDLRNILGEDYDIVLEEHCIHIEYDQGKTDKF